MSLRATLWAYDDAPVENGTEVLVLIALADEASDDGRNAFPGIKKVAARARVKRRAAQYALRKLEKGVVGPDGTLIPIIKRGDQSVAAKVIKRKDRRPVVYDLCMNVSWEAVGKVRPGSEDDDEDTADDGVQDMHPADETSASDDGVQNVHPAERGAISRTNGVQSHDERGAISRTDGVHAGAPDPSLDPTKDPTKDPAGSDDSLRSSSAESTDGPQLTLIDGQDKPPKSDAERIAEDWWKFYTDTIGPIMRSGRSNPFIALRDNIVAPALIAGWTETEIKYALRGPKGSTPDAVPNKGLFQRRLADVRHHRQSAGGATLSTRHHSTNPDDRQAILNSFG